MKDTAKPKEANNKAPENAEKKASRGVDKKDDKPDQKMKKLEKKIKTLKGEIEKLNELNLRRAAEFENFKKRKEREIEEFWKMANAGLIKKLLPIADDFERTLQATEANNNYESVIKGVELVYKSLRAVFAEEGVVEIDALNQSFNPEIHEALMQVEKEGVESNIVLDQHQKGYMLGDNLIRPAQVVVSK